MTGTISVAGRLEAARSILTANIEEHVLGYFTQRP
jgi:hypothetical protein